MRKTFNLLLVLVFFFTCACEDNNKATPEFFTLSTKMTYGQIPCGFSFNDLKIISVPFSDDNKPDFILSVHTNDFGDILGPMLSHPDLENRFIFVRQFNDLTQAQVCFDSISTVSSLPWQTFAYDLKPFGIWLVKTNSGEAGKLLILETRTDIINNAPFAEIKFKQEKIIP
jgi:hypothetical protein